MILIFFKYYNPKLDENRTAILRVNKMTPTLIIAQTTGMLQNVSVSSRLNFCAKDYGLLHAKSVLDLEQEKSWSFLQI